MSKPGKIRDRPGGDTPPSKKTKEKSTTNQQCTLCSEPVTKDALECGWCECLQHSACLGMSVDQCSVLDSVSGNVIFFCSTCVMHLPAAMQSYEIRQSEFEQLKEMDKNIDSRLDALETKLTGVTKQILSSSLSDLSNQIKEHISDLGLKIQSLTSNHSTVQMEVDSATASLQTPLPGSTSLISTASSIADELADRERRKNNIVYNLVENSDREADKKVFSNLCQAVFSKEFTANKVIRLGKRSDNNDRHRPVLVVLQDESDKQFLLVNSSKLRQHDSYKSVYLSPDRTKFERLKYKNACGRTQREKI